MGTKAQLSKARKEIASERERSGGVVLAYIHPGQVSSYFTESLLTTVLGDISADAMGQHPRRIVNILQEWSSANVSPARNTVTQRFLDSGVGEWLLWIDADMQWEPDALELLLAAADPEKAPIVGGLCFGMAADGMYPTIYSWAEIDGVLTTVRVRDYVRDALVRVAATGAAFLLIHRTALEKMAARGFDRAFPFFAESGGNGKPVGEDITFCVRAGILGLPVHVHTGVRIGHHKSALLTEAEFDRQLPAVLPVDVGLVVPTRGDHPELLAAVIAAAGLPAERVAVVDTAGGLQVAGATVVEDLGPVNVHRWWNRGIDLLSAAGCARVAVLNDDVVIAPETLPRLVRGMGGATLGLLDEPGPSGHCWVLDVRHGVRPDEAYRWYCGDLQLQADAEAAHGVARVADAWCMHMHPTVATESDESLRALAAADGELYDRRHPAGSRWERIVTEGTK